MHLADPRIPALDGVVGRCPHATALLCHFHECGQLPGMDELAKGASGLPQVLMGVDVLAVLDRELPQEALLPHALIVVSDDQRSCRFGILGLLEPVGDSQKLEPALQLGVERSCTVFPSLLHGRCSAGCGSLARLRWLSWQVTELHQVRAWQVRASAA